MKFMPKLLIRGNRLLLKRTDKKRHKLIRAEIGKIIKKREKK